MMYFDGGTDSISRKAIRSRWECLGDRQLALLEDFKMPIGIGDLLKYPISLHEIHHSPHGFPRELQVALIS